MFSFDNYNEQLTAICRKYDVKRLVAFGSVLTDTFTKESDLDFLLELNGAQKGMSRYMNIKFDLEELFNRPVDLVMPDAIKNKRLKEYIMSNTRELYGRSY